MATKAISLISKSLTIETILLLIFIFLVPTFGKSIDYSESIIFYTLPSLLCLSVLVKHRLPPNLFTPTQFRWVLSLIILNLVSSVFSVNIGLSLYYLPQLFIVILTVYLLLIFVTPKNFLRIIILSSLIYSLIFLLQNIGLIHLDIKTYRDNFILQVWGHSYLADLLVFAVPTLLVSLRRQNLKRNLVILFTICLAICLSQSRSSLLALLIGLLFIKTNGSVQKYFKIIFLILFFSAISIIVFKISANQLSRKTQEGDRLEYWHQALAGFVDSPLIGTGPNTFSYANKKFQSRSSTNSVYAHNSLLSHLCENGLIFTLIFWSGILIGLKKNYRSHNLFFVLSLIAIINSFFDPSWNSPGIFIISLYFIFYHLVHPPSTKTSPTRPLILLLSGATLISFIFQLISQVFYFNHLYQPSVFFDPINLNSRLSLVNTLDQNSPTWKNNTQQLLFFYRHDLLTYQTLIKAVPFPDNLSYYQQLFQLNPKESLPEYLSLGLNYQQIKSYQALDLLLSTIRLNINPPTTPIDYSLNFAKLFYNQGIYYWNQGNHDQSIANFQSAVFFAKGYSYYYIDLANAYWQTGQKELAKRTLLIDCQEFSASIKHCQDYFNSHLDTPFESPGFMTDTINKN
jgi:tetratricopeptide (TPR) repeat protein